MAGRRKTKESLTFRMRSRYCTLLLLLACMAGRRKTKESITKFRFSFRKFFISKAKKLL
jgi:hypothetical protein